MATTKRKTPKKPEAVPVNTICSVCGLSWQEHGTDPTTDDCIRLLKAELAKRPITIPAPYPVPVNPWKEWPWRPYWKEPYITYRHTTHNEINGQQFMERTPRLLTSSCNAVSSASL